MKSKSTRKRRSRKSSDFPLSSHPRGYWCKRYKLTGTQVWKMAYFQKIADDPEGKASAKTNGLIRIGNEIQRTRSLFKFGVDEGLIDRPVRYGQSFAKPSQKSLRMARAGKGPQMFTAEEIRKILEVATVNVKGLVLLAINTAAGNTDVAEMPTTAVDLVAGWLVYPRVKTAIPRRVPLWPETRTALREVLAQRKPAKNPDDERLLFIGKRGESYIGNHRGYRVHQEFARGLKLAGIEGR